MSPPAAARRTSSAGKVGTCSRKSVPRGLAGGPAVRRQVDHVVRELERHADALAVLDEHLLHEVVGAPNIAPERAEVAISEPVLSASTWM